MNKVAKLFKSQENIITLSKARIVKRQRTESNSKYNTEWSRNQVFNSEENTPTEVQKGIVLSEENSIT